MVQREVQSVEVSFFIQATEDEAKILSSVTRYLHIEAQPEIEPLEGHFGNRILHVRWHLTGEEAWISTKALAALLDSGGKGELKRKMPSYLDEHGALYMRLNKQTLMSGVGVISEADPVRVKVKPRSFMMRDRPEKFYERILELDNE